MKYEKLINALGACVVISGTAMNLLHLPFANPIILSGFISLLLFQSWQVAKLKKRVKELEGK